MSREAMQIALAALEANLGKWAAKTKAVEVLRQALVDADDASQKRVDEKAKREHEWVGLKDEEIHDLIYVSQKIDASNSPWFDCLGFYRAIEAKLKEKNGGEYRNGATTERTKLNQENT
jgi:hypothetical protein